MGFMYAQFGGGEIQTLVGSEFFVYLLPWLFVFAVVYGILSHTGNGGIPKSNSARAVISLVSAFAILPVAPTIIGRLTQLSMGFVIVVSALLVFIILIELLGVKSMKKGPIGQDPSGKVIMGDVPTSIFEAHGKTFAVLVIIIAGLLFAGSGGFDILGIRFISVDPTQFPLLFFMGVIALIIWWLTAEKK
ncbi:MAG: hypothetical protein HZB68_03515 [Candidatus Aenigmarchaeota archaeon]|nr:hypothetical protein [Candidatus Aenigmarchaeota archaeon]